MWSWKQCLHIPKRPKYLIKIFKNTINMKLTKEAEKNTEIGENERLCQLADRSKSHDAPFWHPAR